MQLLEKIFILLNSETYIVLYYNKIMTSKNRVTLATFTKWGKDNVLGKEILEEDGTKYVVKIWCKICTKYKTEILRELKGNAKKSALAFLDGTDNVKSSNVSLLICLWYLSKNNIS